MDASLFHGNLVRSNRIIYTPSVFAKTNLIHLQEIGELQAQKPHTSQRENLSSYLFFMVLKGSGHLDYNNNRFPLKKGDCVFLDCHRQYSHHSSEDLWTLKWVHFYGPNMNGIYEKYVERGGHPSFHPENPQIFETLLNELFRIAESGMYVRDMKIFEKLTGLLTLLMQESWHPERNAGGTSAKRDMQIVKEFLDQHYAKKITLDELAETFYINKYYLTRVFREQFGITITAYLLQVRITHAKQQLRFTDLTIEKIGQDCGLSDANYFARMFKKIEGITPSEYRRRWQSNG